MYRHVCALVASRKRALEVAVTKVVSTTEKTCAGIAFGLIHESTGSSGMSRRMGVAVSRMKNANRHVGSVGGLIVVADWERGERVWFSQELIQLG